MTVAQGSRFKAQGKGFSLQPQASSLERRTGQSVIEYAVLIAVLVAALMGMGVYAKRSLLGKWRGVGDTFGFGQQYEPGVTVTSP